MILVHVFFVCKFCSAVDQLFIHLLHAQSFCLSDELYILRYILSFVHLCVFVTICIVEQLRRQFIVDFHHILHVYQICSLDVYCL